MLFRSKYIHEYDEEELDDLFEQKKTEVEQCKKEKQKIKETLIVLDDVPLSDKSDTLNKIFAVGRHYHISILFLAQYPKGKISPILRDNADYVFVSRLGLESLKVIYEITSSFDNFEQFKNTVHTNNDEFQYIVYDNVSGDIDNVGVIKADEKKFMVKELKK